METDFLEMNNLINKKLFNRFHCISKLGKGTFGNVYKAEYDNEYFALKLESKKNNQNLLEKEAEIMDNLQGTYIPYVELYSSTEEYNILVMELLGKSLNHYIKDLKYFSVKTVCMLGDQILSILKYIHDRDIIHRDIKPDNICMGLNNNSKYAFLIDFGLAKKYRNSNTLLHNPLINKKSLTGTPRYASINALKGMEQSRRDDLESLGYVLIYLLRGELPWQNINGRTKEERNRKILEKKMLISTAKLCEDLPIEFEVFLDYAKNLKYTETPNYEFLKNLFSNIMKNNNYIYNYNYDWSNKEKIEIRDINEIEHKKNKKNDILIYDTKRKNKMNNFVGNKKYNYNKITTMNQNNDLVYFPLNKIKNLNNNDTDDEVNVNCSTACIIF